MPGRFTERILKAPIAFTFRDLILLPGLSQVEPSEIDVRTRVSKRYRLNIPFVSSPMDTVTELSLIHI